MNAAATPRGRCAALVACLVVAAAPLAAESAHPVPVWHVRGVQNDIYLLGSLHLLRESDYPIPSAIYDAYDDADRLIMEIDMDDIDPIATQVMISELGMIQDGRELRDLMGSRLYSKAEAYAEEIGIPLDMLANVEPWFAAITVDNLNILRLGFDPAHGIEMHLMQKARSDGKEITGFETERQQMELLDNLSLKAQRALLIQSLAEGVEIEAVMDDLIRAWRYGDMSYLDEYLLAEMRKDRELFRVLVVDRNKAWAVRIEKLLRERDNYLIVVGAAHLAGRDGVPSLLDRRGHEVEQLRQAD